MNVLPPTGAAAAGGAPGGASVGAAAAPPRPPPAFTPPEPPGGAPPPAFARCLELLGGPSDEHRFAGLLLLAKLAGGGGGGSSSSSSVGGAAAWTPALRSAAFGALGGAGFLRRLLRTGAPAGEEGEAAAPASGAPAAGAGGGDVSLYTSVAVAVIAKFVGDPGIALEFHSAAPALLRVLRSPRAPPPLLCDAAACLAGVVAAGGDLGGVPDAKVSGAMTGALRTLLPAVPAPAAGGRAAGAATAAAARPPLSREAVAETTEDDEGSERDSVSAACSLLCDALGAVLRARPAMTLAPSDLAALGGGLLCRDARVRRSVVDLLTLWLGRPGHADAPPGGGSGGDDREMHISMSDGGPPPGAYAGHWLHDARDGLRGVLASRPPPGDRDAAMALAGALLRRFGEGWALESPSTEATPGTGGAVRRLPADSDRSLGGGRWVLMLLRLASIEVKLVVDDLTSCVHAFGLA